MHDIKGLIHGIERASFHDGPGMRTLVIMKGCPLTCRWCSSPYTQNTRPEILYIASRCTGCGRCIDVCPKNAVTQACDSSLVTTDRIRCTGCGTCVDACVNGARQVSGTFYTADELLHEVEKDAAFYRRSNGGVTVGGGEPTMQSEFVGEFLKLCRVHFLHTAMETCAFASREKFTPLLEQLDLVYIDLKHMEDALHRQWTGVPNQVILDNIKQAVQNNRVILRIPIIPGFNDNEANIENTARFVQSLRTVGRIDILPYNRGGLEKSVRLTADFDLMDGQAPDDTRMAHIARTLRGYGFQVSIGG